MILRQRSHEDLSAGEWIPTQCDMCYNMCGILVRRKDGLAVEIKGNPEHPNNKGKVCGKAFAGLMSLYSPYRVKTPLKRTNPEKGIGVDPSWKQISWDEALDIVAERLRKIRADDPRKLIMWFWERFNARLFQTFCHAFGTPNVSVGPSHIHCGSNRHPIDLTYHASFRESVDFRLCNYFLLFGSQLGTALDTRATAAMAGIAEARARGMKMVVVDPRYTDAAKIANEWIPIRPGTDAAFALALLNLLLNYLHIYDANYLKLYTNAPYLVRQDGPYAREPGTDKPLVWDAGEGKAKAFDASDIQDCLIEGSVTFEGVLCKPAFQLLKDHVKPYTPERVSQITTIPASTIRRLAQEIGEAAQIGSTITMEGVELPLRPFAVSWHKGSSAHKHSMLDGISFKLLSTVLGALDVPGGVLSMPSLFGPLTWPVPGKDGLMTLGGTQYWAGGGTGLYPVRKIRAPETIDLREVFPFRLSGAAFDIMVLNNPEAYGIPYKPEMAIIFRTNVMTNAGSPQEVSEALKKVPFILTISTELDETAEFADIVFPDTHYLEGLSFFSDESVQAGGPGVFWYSLLQPVVDPPFKPPFKVQHGADIFIELARRGGFMDKFNSLLNIAWNLKDSYKLDPATRYSVEELSDRRAKNMFGEDTGLKWLREHGVLKQEKTLKQAYHRVFHNARIPVYFEQFLRAREEIDKICQDLKLELDLSDFQPLPDWKPCPAYQERSSDFDLFCINFKVYNHTFGVTASNPWLNELADQRRTYDIWINADVARRKGIEDGGRIKMETSYGVVAEGRAKLTEGIHPEVVGVPGVFGQWAKGRPLALGKGVQSSSLLRRGLDTIDFLSGALDHCVKVRVSPA
ncbi:MAG: molybdopterin-dependent oxidoreductase [Deltaproteobacteria bacterium]|nr:molybdopterin-dependent oxidoreductase [Deltaproteobacteria bacterium]